MNGTPRDLARMTLEVLFIGGLLAASFIVLQPFLAATVWATTLVIASWPVLIRVETALGGRRGPAVAVMVLVLLTLVVIPLWMAISTLVGQSGRIIALVTSLPTFQMPDPPAWLVDLPLIGEPIAEQWRALAAFTAGDIAREIAPYARTATQWFLGAVGNLGGLFLQLLLTIAIAAVLYTSGESAAHQCRRFGRRLAGERGEAAMILAGQAIRGVALGVVITAVAQSVVGGIGLFAAGVPQAPILTAVMLMLCVAQIGPSLVLIPAIIWLFSAGSTTAGVILVVFGAVAMTMDNFLRPILIRRGADLPLLLILVGVIGGLLSIGLVGLFVGPVILAVSYTLLRSWIDEQDRPEDA